jgi:ceramide glucosyltransferase
MPFTKFEFVLGWLFREVTAPFLFLHAVFSPQIQWRQGCYKLKWGGQVEEILLKVKL